jgi:hypothetical protein
VKNATLVLLVLSLLLCGCSSGRGGRPPAETPVAARSAAPVPSPSPAPTPAPIDFATQIRPLLQEKCSPCHFAGGRMYDRLPFDREETIRTLGTALFTRLKDPVDTELLRAFLEGPKDASSRPPAP